MRLHSSLHVRSGWVALAALSGLGMVVACGADEPLVPVGPPQSALERDTRVRWVVEKDPTTNTASLAFPVDPTPQILAPGADAAAVAAKFLSKYPETFGVTASELASIEVATDSAGIVHAMFHQKANGVAVAFARVSVHFDAQGGVDHVSGPFYPELSRVAAQVLVFDEAGALRNAIAAEPALGIRANGPGTVGPTLDRHTGKLHLAYRLPVVAGGTPRIATVDAVEGKLLDLIDAYPTLRATGTGPTGVPMSFDIDAVPAGQPHAMRFTSTNNRTSVEVRAADPSLTAPTGPESVVQSTDPNDWEPDAPNGGEGTAVDVMAKLQTVEAWYRTKLGRLSYSNKTGPDGALVAYVYGSEKRDFWPGTGLNAAWLGDGFMVFTLNAAKPRRLDYPFTDLDTVAHELTHGITERTSNLYYGGESGALNESISDVFGQIIEHDTLPGSDPASVGDEFDDVIRNMAKPRQFRHAAHVDDIPQILAGLGQRNDDGGGVHLLSGIPNLVWYAVTVGTTNPQDGAPIDGTPLGWERSRDLYWTLNRFELRPYSSFRDAAQKSLLIARNRGYSRQVIGCAWQAVGVLGAAELSANYGISCSGPDAGTESPCRGQRGLVSFCSLTQANAAVVCQDETFVEITLCQDEDDAGPISPQRCLGTDGVDVGDSGNRREAKIRCETIDPDLDSCNGKADGWYCSQIPGYEYAAYSCRSGARSVGQFCEEGRMCSSEDGASTPTCSSAEAGTDAGAP